MKNIKRAIVYTYTSDDYGDFTRSFTLSAPGHRTHGGGCNKECRRIPYPRGVVALSSEESTIPNVPTYPEILERVKQDLHYQGPEDHVDFCRYAASEEANATERAVCTN